MRQSSRNHDSQARMDAATLEPTTLDDVSIAVAVKSPMSPRPLMARLRGKLSLSEAIKELCQTPPADAAERRLLQQLILELSAQHDYLAIGPKGELSKVADPAKTTLAEIACEREVRTPSGVETTRIAAFEVQSYSPVGLTGR